MNVNVKLFYGIETADEFRVPLFAADDIKKIADFLEIEPEEVTPGTYRIGSSRSQTVEEKSSLLNKTKSAQELQLQQGAQTKLRHENTTKYK